MINNDNWLCPNCKHFKNQFEHCIDDQMPDLMYDTPEDCPYFNLNINLTDDLNNLVSFGEPLIIYPEADVMNIYQRLGDKIYTAVLNIDPSWNTVDIELAKTNAITQMLEQYKQSHILEEPINEIAPELDGDFDMSDPTKIIVRKVINGVTYKAEVDIDPSWGISDIEYAKVKALEELDRQYKDIPIPQTPSVQEQQKQQLGELLKTLNTTLEDLSLSNEEADKTTIKINNENDTLNNIMEDTEKIKERIQSYINRKLTESNQSEVSNNEIKLNKINTVTSWERILNNIDIIDNSVLSDSHKAKLLLDECEYIKLLEYDLEWNKPVSSEVKLNIGTTITANDLIIKSRNYCCEYSKYKSVWDHVMNNIDPIIRSKCVPECIYRGFCPKHMNTCKFVYSDDYWKKLAEYRNTKYGKDIIYKYNHELDYIVSNTGKIYQASGYNKNIDSEQIPYTCYEITPKKEIINTGERICVGSEKMPLDMIVYCTFTEQPIDTLKKIKHKDGNIWNNAIENLDSIS